MFASSVVHCVVYCKIVPGVVYCTVLFTAHCTGLLYNRLRKSGVVGDGGISHVSHADGICMPCGRCLVSPTSADCAVCSMLLAALYRWWSAVTVCPQTTQQGTRVVLKGSYAACEHKPPSGFKQTLGDYLYDKQKLRHRLHIGSQPARPAPQYKKAH